MSGPTEEVLRCYERFCPGILSELMHEVARAEKLHGYIPNDCIRATVILTEEVGEVAEAALTLTRPAGPYGNNDIEHLREELIQVAAVAIRMVEAINLKSMI